MKKFLRGRKNSQTQESKPVVSAPVRLASAPAPNPAPDTPLYARFASTSRSEDGHSKPFVAEPKGLSSKTSFSRFSIRSIGGQDRQSRVLSRKSSRQEQVQSKPTVLANPPTRSSSRATPQPAPKAEPSPVSSTAFPRLSSHESARTGQGQGHNYGLYAPTPAMEPSSSRTHLPPSRPRTDSSGSESYAPPPTRPLVVVNGDPETSSTTSFSESALSKAPPPVPATPASPPTQYSRLNQTGFALQDPAVQSPRSQQQQPALRAPAGASRSRYPNVEPPSSTSYTPNRLAHSRSPPVESSPQVGPSVLVEPRPAAQSPPQRATSLLSTPSVTRRKYSPLAAFGLPVATSASMATSSSMQTEAAQSDATHGSSPGPSGYLPTPETTPQEVSLPSFASPYPAPVELSASVPQPTETYARSSERLNHIPPPSPPRSLPHIPSIQDLGDPRRNSEYRSQESVPHAPTDAVDHAEEAPPQPPFISTPTPPVPDTGRGYTPGEAQRAWVNVSEEQPPTPPSRRPQFGTRHFVALSEDRPPTPPSKYPEMRMPDKARSHTDRGRHSRSSPEKGVPPTQQGPVRGKPLIFAAMTSATEIEDIEPEMVIMDPVPVQEKSPARYSAYVPDERHQTSTPPPDPTPEPRREPSPPKRNKLQKRSSSRKAVPPVEEPLERRASAQAPSQPAERSGSSRHRSKRDSVSADPRAQEERHHRSHTSASGESSREHRRRGSSSDGSKQQKRHRDGVKVLTDRQMERLNNRTSYAGASGSREHVEQQTRRSYAEEQSPARPPMPQHGSSHRSSQHYAAPAPVPASHRQTPSPEKPQHARHQVPQIPAAQWPEQPPKRPSPQLPTPPEEYNPMHEPRRDASPQKAKRLSPRHVEDMEVLAGKAQSSRPRSATPEEEAPYPLLAHLADPVLLENLLAHLSYYEWLRLAAVSKETRRTMYEDGREQVLSRYLQTVGYSTWSWDTPEPLMLSVEDLNYYMKGVSVPTHSYAAIAGNWLRDRTSVEARTMQELTFACRAFTRVVLRLRAQAEAEASHIARIAASMPPSPVSMGGPRMRTLSSTSQRLPAKWASQSSLNSRAGSRAPSPSRNAPDRSPLAKKFHSPLFRLRRAPLLQVFVPSPEGDWLSDASVLECEAELKRSGVLHLLRAGDVVWDIAAGDEANAGRLVWDGSYLIDLDYTYSKVGDPPKYLPTLAFPPSYFHRVIRTMGTGNPIVHIDISPWAEDIKANLQLVQDKTRMDTPQGGRHTVVRWVHRSSFAVRPPAGSRAIRLPHPHPPGPGPSPAGAWVVDPDWFGTVVVETEGTNEGLAGLHDRLRGARAPGRRDAPLTPEQARTNERRTVFRILRERSRPGEIWIRVVTDKERIIPL